MTLLCITNQMDDARSCTIFGQHTVLCDGNRYRWNERRGEWDVAGPCTGCLPRLARVGLLCAACFERVQYAFAEWTPEREAMLGSIARAVQRDTGGRTSGPEGYVPIPATILAVNEIGSYLGTFPGDIELWVTSPRGAMDAIRFARAVPEVLRTHELEEKAHKIRRTRCPECRQLTMVWTPPATPSAPVRVVCSNPECDGELQQDSFEKVAAIEDPERTPTPAIVEGGQPVNRTGYFAEDYDPAANPEHAPLDPLTALTRAQLYALAKDDLHFKPEQMRELQKLTKSAAIAAIRAVRPKPGTVPA
ncbi:hypothetical protein [Leifsonia sp. WHRI 6310E]|uniref:hypothetical protein n=1 Tax=Leifsonia sp. WHRI 6310E TaxID=3162562 RepID=UPI0032EDFDFA